MLLLTFSLEIDTEKGLRKHDRYVSFHLNSKLYSYHLLLTYI